MFKRVHGKKNGHWGTAKTWRELNIHYPDHGLPYKKIETLAAECPDCQKHRIAKSTLVLAPSAWQATSTATTMKEPSYAK